MPAIKRLSKLVSEQLPKDKKTINWYPGHMFVGLQTMIGKLNTVDCVIEVHDARIPFTGRNKELKHHLGTIKPHILMLNKRDLADLSRWKEIKKKLADQNDTNVILTDLTGTEFSFATRGYDKLLNNVIELINKSDRHNRANMKEYKVMIAGIPNVGKSTLINRLRQYHLGIKGSPATVGPNPGVTRHVEHMIKICGRPTIYSLDTPGILEPQVGKDREAAMRLALCSNVKDGALKPVEVAQYLLNFLNRSKNDVYLAYYELSAPVTSVVEFVEHYKRLEASRWEEKHSEVPDDVKQTLKQAPNRDIHDICWKLVRDFRKGLLGQVMLDDC